MLDTVREEAASRKEVPVIARIYGQPLAEFPLDLYIPPDALEIMLEAFEGPLDFLLYLIRRANIDILDIPMVPLTRQYLEYVEAMRAANLELAAEYLVMAATLIEIKSRMLLPRPRAEGDEDAGDPRAELARRLLEYEQIRRAAGKIDAHEQAGRDFLWVESWVEKTLVKRYPEVRLNDLENAWRNILRQASLTRHHAIRREELSVREHMGIILRVLKEKGGYVPFASLFTPEMGVSVLIVHFIALLELMREQLIDIIQTEPFAPIYLRQVSEMETSEMEISDMERAKNGSV
ncbi:MAG: segregation/condensation protein A [Betaproteobacteria bacterium]|nr:segregation/condensation protein A [Betaproteobacteria bacterium]